MYRNLGFGPVKQLLYPAAWLTLTLGINIMAIWVVDRFPRNKYMSVGVLGCMVTLIIEAALVAEFVPSDNSAALHAAVAMFFIFQIFYGFCLDGESRAAYSRCRVSNLGLGTQFSYLGELFPTHLRAKGVSLGVAMISFTNIIWLQAAPTAFENIGWKFYLCFIIPGTIGGVIMWFLFPDTNGKGPQGWRLADPVANMAQACRWRRSPLSSEITRTSRSTSARSTSTATSLRITTVRSPARRSWRRPSQCPPRRPPSRLPSRTPLKGFNGHILLMS